MGGELDTSNDRLINYIIHMLRRGSIYAVGSVAKLVRRTQAPNNKQEERRVELPLRQLT